MEHAIDDLGEFFAHAYGMEMESADRYNEFAELLEERNDTEIATIFRSFAAEEARHAATILALAGGKVSHVSLWEFKWDDGGEDADESDDAIPAIVTPQQAVRLALGNEERALAYYMHLLAKTKNEQVREMARLMLKEERHHVAILNAWLARQPVPTGDWHPSDPSTVVE